MHYGSGYGSEVCCGVPCPRSGCTCCRCRCRCLPPPQSVRPEAAGLLRVADSLVVAFMALLRLHFSLDALSVKVLFNSRTKVHSFQIAACQRTAIATLHFLSPCDLIRVQGLVLLPDSYCFCFALIKPVSRSAVQSASARLCCRY